MMLLPLISSPSFATQISHLMRLRDADKHGRGAGVETEPIHDRDLLLYLFVGV